MTNSTWRSEWWTIPVSAAEYNQSTLCFKLKAAYYRSKPVILKSYIIFTYKRQWNNKNIFQKAIFNSTEETSKPLTVEVT